MLAYLNKLRRDWLRHKFRKAFRKGAPVVDYPPRELWIEPTNHCNFRCRMCPQGRGLVKEKGFMDLDLYKAVIEQVRKMCVDRVFLFLGGESLLHRDILEMINIAKRAGVPLTLHSNAGVLTRPLSEGILGTALDEISFSFDAEDPAYYENIRTNACYEKTLENIRYFLEKKKEYGRARPLVTIQVIKPGRLHEKLAVAEDFKKLFSGLPVDFFKAIPFHNFGGTLVETDQIKHMLEKREYVPCRQAWRSMSIDYSGDVVGCCTDLQKKMVFGNVRRSSLASIWNSERMQQFRSTLAEGKYRDLELCRDCDQVWK